jgi:hypothetical protein
MQCVEFEVRLNELLDQRAATVADELLAEHAGACPNCSRLLTAHELLLEGIEMLPTVHLCAAKRHALAHRVVAEVGSTAVSTFQAETQVELAPRRAEVVAQHARPPLALMGLSLAAAAAILIAVFVGRGGNPPEILPDLPSSSLVDRGPSQQTPSAEYLHNDLQPIAWVGFRVADGLKPVTESMVSAYREFRKRPLFRNSVEQDRSSSHSPRDERELLA